MKSLPPHVTDHAVLRYLERVCDVETEELRASIAEICARGNAAGAPVVRWGEARFVLTDNTVVTTLKPEQRLYWQTMAGLMK